MTPRRDTRTAGVAPALPPRFQPIRTLGEGATGVVVEALDTARGVRVAVKALRQASTRGALALREEFRRAAALNHPHLVEVEGLFEHEGAWSIAMELVAGAPWVTHLRGALAAPGAVSEERLRATRTATATTDDGAWDAVPASAEVDRWSDDGPDRTASDAPGADAIRAALRQLVSGVAALHDAGLLHRDLKPSNVLVDGAGRVVILDFGLARGRLDTGRGFAGTALYAAPEQLAGEPLDEAADLYAVGVMLFEALTGRLPFEADGIVALRPRKLQHDAPPARALAPDAPADLAELADALLARDRRARPTAHEVLARLGVDVRAPALGRDRLFVGRGAELAALEAVLSRARASGATELGVVLGESGMGKSALLTRFADEHVRRGGVALVARCHPHEEASFRGIRGILDAAARATSRDLGALLDDAGPHDPDARDRAYAGLAAALRDLGADRPVVVVVDDLHWIDGDGLDALLGIFALESPPVALLVGTRPEAEHELAALRRSFPRSSEIEIEPLPPGDAADLAARLGRFGVAPEETAALARASAGHPLLLRELALGGGAHRGIDEALVDRARALRARELDLLQTLALAGRPLTELVLAEAVDLDGDALQAGLRHLRRGGWVRVTSVNGVRGASTAHDRIGEVVAAQIDPARARARHAALAAALERHGGEESAPAAVVRHLEAAGDSRAAELAVRAARKASSGLAFAEAAELLDLALRLGSPSDALRARHADALARAGRGREAADILLELASTAEEPRRSELLQRAAEQLLTSGELERGLAAIEEVLAGVGDRLPASTGAAVLRLAAAKLRARGAERARRAPPPADPDPSVTRAFAAFRSVAFGLGMIDNLRAALYHTRALDLALRHGDDVQVGEVLGTEAIFRGSTTTAARHAARALSDRARAIAARRGGDERITIWADAADAVLDAFDAPTARAVARLDDVRARFHGGITCAGWARSSLSLIRALSRRLSGDFVGVRRDVALGLRDAQRRGDRFLEVSLDRGAVLLDLVADDPAAARARLARAAWTRPGHGSHIQDYLALEAEAEIDLYVGASPSVLLARADALVSLRRSLVGRLQRVRVLSLSLEGRLLVAALAQGAGGLVARARAGLAARRLDGEDVGYARVKAAAIRAGLAAIAGDHAARDAAGLALVEDADRDGLRIDAALARLVIAASGGPERAAAARTLDEESVVDPRRLLRVYLPGTST